MQKVTNIAKNITQDLAVNAITNIAMNKLTGVTLRKSIIKPIKQQNINYNKDYLIKIAKKSVTDELGDLAAQCVSNTRNQYVNTFLNSVTDSIVQQAIKSFEQKPENIQTFCKQAGIQTSKNLTKDFVYKVSKDKLDYGRIPKNFIAGYLAGDASEFVASKLEDREPQYVKVGVQTGLGKVVYGEIRSFVSN